MQEVSGVYTSPFLHTDERKMASRARKLSGAFEKRAPDVFFLPEVFSNTNLK